jgi:hypothetical protein
MPGLDVSLGLGSTPISAASVAALSTANAQFGQTANGTVGNTLIETTLLAAGAGSPTIAANAFTAGKLLFLYGYGFITNTVTPTLRIRMKLGGVTILDTTAFTMATITGTTQWQISAVATCRTTGAGGTGIAQAQLNYFTAPGTVVTQQLVNNATFALNTTIANVMDLTAQWGTADPLNTLTATNMSAVLLG